MKKIFHSRSFLEPSSREEEASPSSALHLSPPRPREEEEPFEAPTQMKKKKKPSKTALERLIGAPDNEFGHGMVQSFISVFATELGDKTFFLCALYAARGSPHYVFLASWMALVVMTGLSALLGVVLTSAFLPSQTTSHAVVCLLFFLIGGEQCYRSWQMYQTGEGFDLSGGLEEAQREVDGEVQETESPLETKEKMKSTTVAAVSASKSTVASESELGGSPPKSATDDEKVSTGLDLDALDDDEGEVDEGSLKEGDEEASLKTPSSEPLMGVQKTLSDTVTTPAAGAGPSSSILTDFTLHAFLPAGMRESKTAQLLVSVFVVTVFAEIGDKSQLATTALGSVEDLYGVILGGVLGHALCSGIAVCGGAILASKMSERSVTLVGGVVFLLFALHGLATWPVPKETYTSSVGVAPKETYNLPGLGSGGGGVGGGGGGQGQNINPGPQWVRPRKGVNFGMMERVLDSAAAGSFMTPGGEFYR